MPTVKSTGIAVVLHLLLLLLLSSPVLAQKIVVISDINGRYGSTEYSPRVAKAVQTILELKPDLVIGAGDMVAGQKQPLLDQSRLDDMWAAFNQTVADPLKQAGIEFLISPGNHDASALPGFELEQERFNAQWLNRLPGLRPLEGSEWPRRYALWLGKTLIISIDGTRPGRLQQADLNLLRATLKRESSKAQSIIVVSHLPQWPFARGREKDIITDPELTDLLTRYDVDFFISGHHHVFYPGVDDHGVNHLAVGPLGGNARKFVGQSTREPFSFLVLDISIDGFSVSAFRSPDFQQEISLTGLPAKIKGSDGFLTRLDLLKSTSAQAAIDEETTK